MGVRTRTCNIWPVLAAAMNRRHVASPANVAASRRPQRRGLLSDPIRLKLILAAGLMSACATAAAARAEAPSPTETSRISPAGNYLAARVAGQARDMTAAAAYYRGALRADPKNPELIENTFLVVLGTGNIEDSFPLAERMVRFEKSHRMARL